MKYSPAMMPVKFDPRGPGFGFPQRPGRKPAWLIGLGLAMLFTVNALIGGDPWVGIAFVTAVGLGLHAVRLNGGLRSAMGLLCFSVVLRYLLIGIVVKSITLERWDDRLLVPRSTAIAMLCGFGGMWLAAAWVRFLPLPTRSAFIKRTASPRDDLRVGLSIAGVTILAQMMITLVQEGRGVVLPFGALLPASLSYLIFFGFNSRHRFRWVPAAIVAGIEFRIGVLGGSKQGLLTPMMAFGLCYLLRFGLNRRILLVGSLMALVSLTVFYPFSQYVKSEERGSPAALFFRFFADPELRAESRGISYFSMKEKEMNYVSADVGMLERMMLVKSADRLIWAADMNGRIGWTVISSSLKNFIPRILWPSKEDFNIGNYYGVITEVLNSGDTTTSVSFTLIGSFYSSFGSLGVFLGILVFYLILTYLVDFLTGGTFPHDARPAAIVSVAHHMLAEPGLDGAIFAMLTIVAYALSVKAVELLKLAEFLRSDGSAGSSSTQSARTLRREHVRPAPMPRR